MAYNYNRTSHQLLTEIQNQLQNHSPFDEREEVSISETLALIEGSDSNCLDRSKSDHHITGSAFVLSKYGLLLHFHKKYPMWIQPGGHLDEGELPLDAASRETFEETGVIAKFEPQLFHVDVHDAGSHIHYDMRYLANVIEPLIDPGAEESFSVAWFGNDALGSIKDEANLGVFKKLNSLLISS